MLFHCVLWNSRFVRFASNPELIKHHYSLQLNQPNYQRLIQDPHRAVLGSFDDHDYGLNDGGAEFVFRAESKDLLLEFLNEPQISPRWNHSGAYAAYTYGHHYSNRQTLIILLDNRYFHSEKQGIMLGEEQWEWFGNVLRQHPHVSLIIITSGIQMVSINKPIGESWRRTPADRIRLFETIQNNTNLHANHTQAVLLLSGDVHLAELTISHYCHKFDDVTRVTPLIELTSSGLTHALGLQLWPIRDHLNGRVVIV